jgi:hypothetical protein
VAFGGGAGPPLAGSAFGGSPESGNRFCVGNFGRNLASIAVKMFSNVIYFMKKLYKVCTFNAICNYNAAISCITLQHKKFSFTLTSAGHTKLIVNRIFIHEVNISITLRINIAVKLCRIRWAGQEALIGQMKNRIVVILVSISKD